MILVKQIKIELINGNSLTITPGNMHATVNNTFKQIIKNKSYIYHFIQDYAGELHTESHIDKLDNTMHIYSIDFLNTASFIYIYLFKSRFNAMMQVEFKGDKEDFRDSVTIISQNDSTKTSLPLPDFISMIHLNNTSLKKSYSKASVTVLDCIYNKYVASLLKDRNYSIELRKLG